jgi:hypothetical protein
MWIHDIVSEALLLIGRLQDAATSARRNQAEFELWRHIRESIFFISGTGQDYRLEDYLKSLEPTRPSLVSETFKSHADADMTSQRAMSLLLRTLDERTDPEEKRLITMLMNTMNFIASSGQWHEFEGHLKNHHVDAPPAFLYFETPAEAEEWLRNEPQPPSWTRILVDNEYFETWHYRDTDERKLQRSNIIELFLEDFQRKGFPPAVASFHTREEALQWIEAHVEAPMSFIHIGGENHLVVYQKRLGRHSLHHVASTLAAWHEEKKQRAEHHEDLTPSDPDDEAHE